MELTVSVNISERFRLDGRVALITGASGGIGRETSKCFAELGCKVLLLDRDLGSLTALAERLKDETGAVVEALAVDLEQEAERIELIRQLKADNNQLDVLVNNAAFVGQSDLRGWAVPIEEQQLDTWRRALEVNLTACFHLSQAFAPLLSASGHGAIVNIGSIYGVVGPNPSIYKGTDLDNPAAYAVSKGGLIQLTRWCSTVLAPNVRVNCVSPGGIRRQQPEMFVNEYVARTPLRRMGRENDIVGAIAFLATDLSLYVTGQNLIVDGGWTAW